jgi:hypothetical protein
MDSSDNVISNTPSLSGSDSSSNEDSHVWKYIIIFIILAVLGFNLFTYAGKFSQTLGKLTDRIIDIFRPILAYFGYGVTSVAKKTVDLTASSSKKMIDVTSGTLIGGIGVLERGLSKENKDYLAQGTGAQVQSTRSQVQGTRSQGTRSQGKVPAPGPQQVERANKKIQYPEPDEAGSNTQLSKGKSKSGFCYIGEDRGFRSCISVGEGDTCMSGDIFPTREVCINPSLRSTF